MTQQNIERLESIRHVFKNRGGSNNEIMTALQIMHETYDPTYVVLMYCDACKMKLVDSLFLRYDNENK